MTMLDRSMIETKVQEVLARELGIEMQKITLESKLVDDLKMDSFASVELNFALEDALGVKIEDKEAMGFVTVEDVVNYIINRGSVKGNVHERTV